MLRTTLIATLALLTGSGLQAATDISKVNGSIRIDANANMGDLSTVNGSIAMEEGASATDVRTVNGSIVIDERVTVSSLETVNGRIKAGSGSRTRGPVSTVNGSITLERDAEVDGNVTTVNGRLELDGARVRGRLETVSGNIDLGRGSRVAGGILIEKPGSTWHSYQRSDAPKVVIGPEAVVEGTLRFEREVELYVSNRATIGPVEGASPVIFDGERP